MTAELHVRSDVKCKALVNALVELGVTYTYTYVRFIGHNVIEFPDLTQEYAETIYNRAIEQVTT